MRVVDEASIRSLLSGLPVSLPRFVVSGNFATPCRLLALADESIDSYRLFMLNAQPGIPVREGVVHETPFVGPGMRACSALCYVPARLSLVPRLLSGRYQPDVVLLHTSTPRAGTISLGTEVNILPAAVESCRTRGGVVIAQLNSRMPHTHGDGVLDTSLVDFGFEADEELSSPGAAEPDGSAAAVAERVASFVEDGSTVQAGIGAIPDTAMAHLRSRHGLRIWSEMVSDGLLDLDRVGALDDGAPIVASFCFGGAELYEFIDDNPRVQLRRTEIVNDPATIARQRLMVSINSALQVDLYAQANAHRIGGRVHSGLGGQSDFVVGAMHATGGQAIVALRSWHPRADVSAVVPLLPGPATSFQHSHIVTDVGSADIFGVSEPEQAAQVIGIADPRARDGLEQAAASMGLRPRSSVRVVD